MERFFDSIPRDREDFLKDRDILVVGLRGLGDNIYQRAFVKDLKFPIYLNTPWPEIYSDLPNVKFVPCTTYLRTQNKNLDRYPKNFFINAPEDAALVNIIYNSNDMIASSIQGRLAQQFKVSPKTMDLPKLPPYNWPSYKDLKSPYVVVRPVTVRREWMNVARNPKSSYIYEACEMLREAGYFVISICDLDENNEWMVTDSKWDEFPADVKFHKGELNLLDVLSLVQGADACVGGAGWLIPAALACSKPMLVIAGGQGAHNGPKQLSDSDFCDVSKLNWLLPDEFCRCVDFFHDCPKYISNFKEKTEQWIKSLRS